MAININFAEDVREGLSSKPKFLHSKYFYDERGDKLFQQIMELEEYYLTDCELEIFETTKDDILKLLRNDQDDKVFDVIEFGAGDGIKTRILIEHFISQKVKFKYFPVDISSSVLGSLEMNLRMEFPGLDIHPVCDDYFHALEELNKADFNKKIILFLGSNIGNFRGDDAIPFLRRLHADMNAGDFLFVGFDLKKDPQIILNAYNDKQGITREFNLNLLDRINRELGGNFKRNQFEHYPTYNPLTGETKSYIISLTDQTVRIDTLSQSFSFEKWEPVFTEISQKYSLEDIERLATLSGFYMQKNFFDHRQYFTNSLWAIK